MTPGVQDELKLTQAQRDKVKSAMKSMYAPPKPGERPTDADFRKRMEEMRKKHEQAQQQVLASLTAPQKARLRQITLQMYGAAVISHPEISRELGITADQKKKLAAVQAQNTEEMRKAFPPLTPPGKGAKREEFRKHHEMSMSRMQQQMSKVSEIRKRADARIVAILTAVQKKKWQQMVGKKFQMPPFRTGRG